MLTRSAIKRVRADVVMKAMELPSSFQLDRYLTKSVDYDENEVCIRSKNGAKYRKVNKVEYTLTNDGVDKLSYITHKCNVKCINDFMNTSVTQLPVVYLFVVMNDEIIKKVGGDTDTHVLVKYGYTNNLQRRMTEHVKTYGSSIILKYHVYVDPNNLKEAENEVRNFFHATKWHVIHPNYSELALVPTEYLGSVVYSQFQRIGATYMQKMMDMSNQIASLKRELEFSRCLLAEKERTIGIAIKHL